MSGLVLPVRFPAANPPLESTDGSPMAFLWLNVSVNARTANACDLAKQFDAQARTIGKTPHHKLSRTYDYLSYNASLPWKAAWVKPHYGIKVKMQWTSPPKLSPATLADRLLQHMPRGRVESSEPVPSRPPLMVGRLGNVESTSCVYILVHKKLAYSVGSNWLGNVAGVYVRTAPGKPVNYTRVAEVERIFATRYVDAVRRADTMLLLGSQSTETMHFLCPFGFPLTNWVQGYGIDEFLQLLVALAARNTSILLVTGFPQSISMQLLRLRLIHPHLPLEGLSFRVLGTPQAYAWNKAAIAGHDDWVEALEALQASEEWDPARNQVALLSCGAFGMPLAHHAVKRGVAAVYVGGRMPALFGIIGAVDRELPAVRKRMNAHWQPPLTVETPSQKGRDQFHGNSYWG